MSLLSRSSFRTLSKRARLTPLMRRKQAFSASFSAASSCVPIRSVEKLPNAAVRITWEDNKQARFHNVWLRDHCMCPVCKHEDTKQRLIDTASIETGANMQSIEFDASKDSVDIHWQQQLQSQSMESCNKSAFSSTWLREHVYDTSSALKSSSENSARTCSTQRKSWGKELMQNFPTVSHEQYWQSSSSQKSALEKLYKYGVLCVRGTPPTVEAVQKVGESIGFIQQTIYGTMWTTSPESEHEQYHDTASTNWALPSHTDCTYHNCPPGLQLFNCARQAQEGGSSRFVDGKYVVERLMTEYPDAYTFFKSIKIPALCIDEGAILKTMEPMIEEDVDGCFKSFRLNDTDRDVLTHLDFDDIERFYKFHKQLQSIITAEESKVFFRMEVGDLIIVENQRVMHGREQFDGKRSLVGCYIGLDEYESKLRTLNII